MLHYSNIPRSIRRLLKNGHLLRSPHLSSLRRTAKYASLLRISWALHLALFEQPGKNDLFSSLLEMQLDHVPLIDEIIPLHHLPVKFSGTPHLCISKFDNEILMNGEGDIFHRTPLFQNNRFR